MRKPNWLNKKIDFKKIAGTDDYMKDLGLHTVCHQARCPNISECFHNSTATFLILGDTCTRQCGFCSVKKGTPKPIDKDEPKRVLEAVKRMKLRYVVITSVTRDDMEDGGAEIFAQTIKLIKEHNIAIKVEVLAPDFKGDFRAIQKVLDAKPEIFGHNLEVVPSLYNIRKGADYGKSLQVLAFARKTPNIFTKSGIMLGLGEKHDEVKGVFSDLRKAGCEFLSIGQYLRPGNQNYEVVEFIKPEKFEEYKNIALDMGFLHVESGPYVRSSYHAGDYLVAGE